MLKEQGNYNLRICIDKHIQHGFKINIRKIRRKII